MNMRVLTWAAYLLVASAQGPPAPSTASAAIVFVCEHGAAKSVIATAYFNKLAAERGLPHRATFRGTSPQAELSERTVAALHADGRRPHLHDARHPRPCRADRVPHRVSPPFRA